jgi:hypothetical protein
VQNRLQATHSEKLREKVQRLGAETGRRDWAQRLRVTLSATDRQQGSISALEAKELAKGEDRNR